MDIVETIVPTPNPLLSNLRIPGETFRLPSHGLFYTDGELDDSVVNGEVEVYPMTAIEEVILSTPDKLMSGKAVMEIFARCIPQIKKPGQLLAKDVDFLMVCLRMVTFGQFMEVSYEHDCENAKEHSYMVDLQAMIRGTRALDATKLNEEYAYTTPNGQVVRLKPLTYSDIVQLYQTTALMKTDDVTEEESKKLIIDTLVSVIKSVDDVTDRAFILEWIEKVPLGWKRNIQKAAQSVSQWGIEFESKHVCQDCGEDIKIFVSPNPVSFFM